MMSNLYPSVVDNISVFTLTRTERVRAEKTKQAEGCDTGLAPVYPALRSRTRRGRPWPSVVARGQGARGKENHWRGCKRKGSSRDSGGGGEPYDVRPAGREHQRHSERRTAPELG